MQLTKNDKIIISQVLRQGFYFALIILFIFAIHFIAYKVHGKTFAEHGIIENIQLGILFAATFSFFLQAKYNAEYRIVLLLLASASMMACFRELDKFFDAILPIVSWRIGLLLPFFTVGLALKNLKKVKKSLKRFLVTPAFNMMFCAMIIIVPVAQCIGHGPFVRNVLEIQDISAIKELFEEASEALGYMLIFLASLECIWSMPKK